MTAAITVVPGATFDALDRAAAELDSGFEALPGFTRLPLAPELARAKGAYGGKTLTLEATAFRAHGIRIGRVVRIDGPGTWILNTVVFPEDGFTTPILGVELLVFRERMHLIVADMFPLVDEDAGIMDALAPAFDDVGEQPEMPAWATKIFSRRPIFRKPRSATTLAEGARAVDVVGRSWLARARSARIADDAIAHEASRRRHTYVVSHAEDEPANPFLAKTFGDVTGRRLVDEVLFPAAAFA